MRDVPLDEDPLLATALEEFRQLPLGDAPAGILVSLLEKQAATRSRPRGARMWAAAAVGVVALVAGFWAGRLTTEYPEEPPPDATLIENRVPAPQLPEPPRIPFAAA
jgi:hypothetical protein